MNSVTMLNTSTVVLLLVVGYQFAMISFFSGDQWILKFNKLQILSKQRQQFQWKCKLSSIHEKKMNPQNHTHYKMQQLIGLVCHINYCDTVITNRRIIPRRYSKVTTRKKKWKNHENDMKINEKQQKDKRIPLPKDWEAQTSLKKQGEKGCTQLLRRVSSFGSSYGGRRFGHASEIPVTSIYNLMSINFRKLSKINFNCSVPWRNKRLVSSRPSLRKS